MANKSIPQLPVLATNTVQSDLFHVVRGGLDYQASASQISKMLSVYTAYVGKDGNDATAGIGNISAKYLTIKAAVDAVVLAGNANGGVYVCNGDYAEDTITLTGGTTTFIYLEDRVTLSNLNGAAELFNVNGAALYLSGGYTITVTDHPCLIATNSATVIVQSFLMILRHIGSGNCVTSDTSFVALVLFYYHDIGDLGSTSFVATGDCTGGILSKTVQVERAFLLIDGNGLDSDMYFEAKTISTSNAVFAIDYLIKILNVSTDASLTLEMTSFTFNSSTLNSSAIILENCEGTALLNIEKANSGTEGSLLSVKETNGIAQFGNVYLNVNNATCASTTSPTIETSETVGSALGTKITLTGKYQHTGANTSGEASVLNIKAGKVFVDAFVGNGQAAADGYPIIYDGGVLTLKSGTVLYCDVLAESVFTYLHAPNIPIDIYIYGVVSPAALSADVNNLMPAGTYVQNVNVQSELW